MKNMTLTETFRKYFLPVLNEKCVTPAEYSAKATKIEGMLMREDVRVYCSKMNVVYGYSYVDEKGHPHVVRFTWEEERFFESFLANFRLNRARAEKDWFFRPWRVKAN